MTQVQASGRITQLEETLQALIRAGEEFVRGPGCRVEVDLDYCAALAELEQAVEQGKRIYPRREARHGHGAHSGR